MVSWEKIVSADPKVIVIADMDRRRYVADDPAVKIKFLETDPVTSQLEAVKGKHFIQMSSQAMSPTIRAVDGLEALANGIKSFGLAN